VALIDVRDLTLTEQIEGGDLIVVGLVRIDFKLLNQEVKHGLVWLLSQEMHSVSQSSWAIFSQDLLTIDLIIGVFPCIEVSRLRLQLHSSIGVTCSRSSLHDFLSSLFVHFHEFLLPAKNFFFLFLINGHYRLLFSSSQLDKFLSLLLFDLTIPLQLSYTRLGVGTIPKKYLQNVDEGPGDYFVEEFLSQSHLLLLSEGRIVIVVVRISGETIEHIFIRQLVHGPVISMNEALLVDLMRDRGQKLIMMLTESFYIG
jgi:hypothetical protein